MPLSIRALFAARRRWGSTGRLPSVWRGASQPDVDTLWNCGVRQRDAEVPGVVRRVRAGHVRRRRSGVGDVVAQVAPADGGTARVDATHVEVGVVSVAGVVEEVVGHRMVVGVETGRLVEERHREADGVLRRVGFVVAAVAARLEAGSVAGGRRRSGHVTVAPGPRVLDDHGRVGGDEVEPVIGVPPRAAAPEHVRGAAGRRVVRTEPVGVLAGTVVAAQVVVVVRVRVEDEVASPAVDEQAGAHVVVGVDLLEGVVAARDPDPPGLGVLVVVLRNAPDFQSFEVDPAAGDVEALDAAVVRHP